MSVAAWGRSRVRPDQPPARRGPWYYPSALVVVRAALEHHPMDRLLFLSRLFVEWYGGVKEEGLPAENKRLASLKAGPKPEIARWWRDKQTGQMHVVTFLPLARLASPGRAAATP